MNEITDPRALVSDEGKSLLKTKRDGKADDLHKSSSGLDSSGGSGPVPSAAAAALTASPPPAQPVVLTEKEARDLAQRRALHVHSPLTDDEERRLTPMLPLGSKIDRANFDQFFAVLRSFDRTKWQWVLETHLYMVATMNAQVSKLLLHNWHIWYMCAFVYLASVVFCWVASPSLLRQSLCRFV
jgi:hypothetical protein